MFSSRPDGENWIISASSGRAASGASSMVWVGMRVMAPLDLWDATAGWRWRRHREGRGTGPESDVGPERPGSVTSGSPAPSSKEKADAGAGHAGGVGVPGGQDDT